MKITCNGDPFHVDVKRLYVPAVLEGKCPKCDADYTSDFMDHYLSYPTANEPFERGCYCQECMHEWKVTLKLNLTLEVA